MSSHIPATPGTNVIALDAHPKRFPVGAYAHHNAFGFCEIVACLDRPGWRTVRWEEFRESESRVHTADVSLAALQRLTD